MMQYMAERFLYLPLIGWTLAVAAALLIVPRLKLVVALSSVVVSFWAIVAWERSAIWQNNFTLFVRSSQQGIRVQRIEENAVAAILRQPHMTNVFVPNPHDRKKAVTIRQPPNPAEWEPIMATLQQAKQLFPEDENLLTALGVAHFLTGQPDAAASFFKKAAEKTPQSLGSWINFGRAAFESRQYGEAESAYRAALRLQPTNLVCLRGLAHALVRQQKSSELLPVAEQIAAAAPDDEENRQWLSEARNRAVAQPGSL
jgi:tetratricopeptide (TPR) repeat protein